jgi:ribosome-binding protein aMBF1 (putative translation factor)
LVRGQAGRGVQPPRSAAAVFAAPESYPEFEIGSQEQKRKDAALSKAIPRPRRVFAHNLRRLREQAGLTQTAVAELTGMKPSRISEYESGAYACTIDMLERFTEAFDVPLTALFDETDFVEPKRSRKR